MTDDTQVDWPDHCPRDCYSYPDNYDPCEQRHYCEMCGDCLYCAGDELCWDTEGPHV